MKEFVLPKSIEQTLQNRFPKQYLQVLEAHQETPRQFIRQHPYKTQAAILEFAEYIEPSVYAIQNHSFIQDPDWHSGSYYVQEANSMWTGKVFQSMVLPHLPEGSTILDACAAPGGKSTHLASLMKPNDILVSNEIDRKRFHILVENMNRWGNSQIICTHSSPKQLSNSAVQFDFINIDAPCSGQGLMRKMPQYASSYKAERVLECSLMQQDILHQMARILKPGGFVIYSTCTFSEEENDGQIKSFLAQHQEFNPVQLPLIENGIETEYGVQFLPGISLGEGFYICLLQKSGDLAPSNFYPSTSIHVLPKEKWMHPEASLLQHQYGYSVGEQSMVEPLIKMQAALGIAGFSGMFQHAYVKGRAILPTHTAAYQNKLWNPEYQVNVDQKNALIGLKKEAFELNFKEKGAIYQVQHRGNGLFTGKYLGNRFNNYLPEPYRIKQDLT